MSVPTKTGELKATAFLDMYLSSWSFRYGQKCATMYRKRKCDLFCGFALMAVYLKASSSETASSRIL